MAKLLGPQGGVSVYYHPKSPGASLESLQRLAGIIRLTRPVPFTRPLDDEVGEDDSPSSERACD